MVGAAYAYFNYTFSRFNFINFSEWVFYTGDGTIFEPEEPRYIVLFHSSLQGDVSQVLKKVNNKAGYPVLAIDLSQNRRPGQEDTIHLTAGINTLLKVIARFRVTHSPSVLLIERQKNTLYKQATLLENL